MTAKRKIGLIIGSAGIGVLLWRYWDLVGLCAVLWAAGWLYYKDQDSIPKKGKK